MIKPSDLLPLIQELDDKIALITNYLFANPEQLQTWIQRNTFPSGWHAILAGELLQSPAVSIKAYMEANNLPAEKLARRLNLSPATLEAILNGSTVSAYTRVNIAHRTVMWDTRIFNFRRRYTLTQQQLAKLIDVGQATLSNWERGVSAPGIYHQRALSKVFADLTTTAQPPEEPSPASIPPPKPSAIRPIWAQGKLILSNEPSQNISPEKLKEALRAIKLDLEEFVSDLNNDMQLGSGQNFDPRPVVHLTRTAERITDNPLPHEALRVFHAAEAMIAYAGVVGEEWPPFLAARYNALALHIASLANQFEDWRALKKVHLSKEALNETPSAIKEFIEIVSEGDEKDAIIDKSIPTALKELLGDFIEKVSTIADQFHSSKNAGADALAADLLNAVDNIAQRLAQAAFGLKDGAIASIIKSSSGAAWAEFKKELPNEGKRLGKVFSKLIVWGPISLVASALASQFGWLAPIAKFLSKLL